MDDHNEFNALLGRIGFNSVAQRNEITEQGVTTCSDLADLSKDELEAIYYENRNTNRRRTMPNQVTLPILAKSRLDAIRYEMNLRTMCSKPMDLTQIQGLTLVLAKGLVKQKSEREEGIKQSGDLPNPDVPKLEKGNWRTVRDSFTEMITRQIGSNGIPLLYVVRENATGDYDSPVHNSVTDKLVACATHSGAKYDVDNKSIYSLINSHFEGSEAESTVKGFTPLLSLEERECVE